MTRFTGDQPLPDLFLEAAFARLRLRMLSTVELGLADEIHRMTSQFYKIKRDLGLPQAWDPRGPLQETINRLDPIRANFNLIRLEKGML